MGKHVKGEGRGSSSKVTWFVRLQKYLEKVSDMSASVVAFSFLHDRLSADVSLSTAWTLTEQIKKDPPQMGCMLTLLA